MTRGTFYLINNNMIIETIEFNGDMYQDGHGLYAIDMLERVKSTNEFRNAINKFNKEQHSNYAERLLYLRKYSDYMTKDNLIEMTDNNYSEYFFSDWTFWKNISDKTVKIKTRDNKTIKLKPNEQVAISFGFYDNHYKNVKECKKWIKANINEN